MHAASRACAEVGLLPVQVGCGADELIDLLMRCVLDPGEKIIDCPPTFTMYAFDADVNDARVVTVPRLDGFRIDIEGVK
jgi:histidinol-phosphate aminotransferase